MIIYFVILVSLLALSGYADATGFYHSSKIWQGATANIQQVILAARGYIVGISCYWMVLKMLQKYQVVSAEVQTAIWFMTTVIFVSALSGEVFKWAFREQVVAAIALISIGWLLIATKQ